jgi:hypothetical protein
MTTEAPGPQDAAFHPTEQATNDHETSGKSSEPDVDSAEDQLDELGDTPALEEDDDSPVKPDNS